VVVVFTWIMVRNARREVAGRGEPGLESAGGTGKSTLFLVLGMGLLVVGGKLVVQGATGIALRAGLSERLVGLTIVAMGTSLPEVASSLVAAYRGRTDVAVGNIVGSCIFNLLGILGVGSLLVPLRVNPQINGFDVWWMLGFTALLAPLIYFGHRRVSRIDGVVLTGSFAAYLAMLIIKG
jgi:cation:H+ antiporter